MNQETSENTTSVQPSDAVLRVASVHGRAPVALRANGYTGPRVIDLRSAVCRQKGGRLCPLAARVPQGQRATAIRRAALADMAAGRYRSAYRKIVQAAELHPFSSCTAGDRQAIAALYRGRLDTYLYCMLVPWLPFFIYTRLPAAAAEGAGAALSEPGPLVLPALYGLYALSFGAAGWIYTVKSRIK